MLFADQNQNARYERQNSHHDCADRNVEKRGDSDKDQVDREQQHSDIFCHARLLTEIPFACTPKVSSESLSISYLSQPMPLASSAICD
jgi:hypothetical protein